MPTAKKLFTYKTDPFLLEKSLFFDGLFDQILECFGGIGEGGIFQVGAADASFRKGRVKVELSDGAAV